jgi:hypothetical protein
LTVAPLLALPYLVMRPEMHSRLVKGLAIVLLSWGFVLSVASNICNTLYHLAFLNLDGAQPGDRLIWSWTGNQAVDTLGVAARNLARTIYGGAYEIVPGASKADVDASNTINVWFLTAHRLGVPDAALMVAVLALSASVVICLMALYRIRRESVADA